VQDRSLIATNFHVIDGAAEAKVEFPSGKTIAVNGFLIASPGYDLAILQLAERADVPPLQLRKEKPDLGAEVFTVGSPKGLAGSVSKGVVSAHRRWSDLKPFLGDSLDEFGYEPQSIWIQTDAAINSGNSGGPLVLETGDVVAVNTLASPASVGQNINFAVSVDHLADFLNKLPPRPLPFAELPASPKSRELMPTDDADATLAYWSRISKVVGQHMYEYQKLEIKAGLFKVSSNGPNQRGPGGKKAWETDPAYGKTEHERRSRLHRLAAQAGVPIAQAEQMTLNELRQSVNAAKSKDATERYEAKQRQTAFNGLPPEIAVIIAQQQRIKKKGSEEMGEVADLLGDRAAIANQAAHSLEAVASAGVNKAVVSFTIDLASAFRRYALACLSLQRVADLASEVGLTTDFEEALYQRDQSEKALAELRDVSGPELRARLNNLYGDRFGILGSLTDEQLKVFQGKRAPYDK
jgi:hypothetical protein